MQQPISKCKQFEEIIAKDESWKQNGNILKWQAWREIECYHVKCKKLTDNAYHAMSSKRKKTLRNSDRRQEHKDSCEATLTLWNLPRDFSCVTLPAWHCYSVPTPVSLSHKIVSFLLIHWFVVPELSSFVHAGAVAVWKTV